MNKSVRAACGQWLYFLGSDDYLFDKKIIEKIAENLSVLNCDVLYGDVIMGDRKKPYDGFFDFNKLLKQNISHQAIFYKKELFERLGFYNTRYKIYADWDFNIRCFQQTNIRIIYKDIIVAHFPKGNTSNQYDILFLREVIIPLRLERLMIKFQELKDIKIYDEWWRLLRNAKIRGVDSLHFFSQKKKIPVSIMSMIAWQKNIPMRVLKLGPISKICMAINYLFNLKRIKADATFRHHNQL
jgi:hypothetical protein